MRPTRNAWAPPAQRPPWYVVPADDKQKPADRLAGSSLETLEGLKMTYPETSAKRRRELLAIRKKLAKE